MNEILRIDTAILIIQKPIQYKFSRKIFIMIAILIIEILYTYNSNLLLHITNYTIHV